MADVRWQFVPQWVSVYKAIPRIGRGLSLTDKDSGKNQRERSPDVHHSSMSRLTTSNQCAPLDMDVRDWTAISTLLLLGCIKKPAHRTRDLENESLGKHALVIATGREKSPRTHCSGTWRLPLAGAETFVAGRSKGGPTPSGHKSRRTS